MHADTCNVSRDASYESTSEIFVRLATTEKYLFSILSLSSENARHGFKDILRETTSTSNARDLSQLLHYNNEFLITRMSSDKKRIPPRVLLFLCFGLFFFAFLAISLSASFLDTCGIRRAEYANGILKRQLDFSMDFIVDDWWTWDRYLSLALSSSSARCATL